MAKRNNGRERENARVILTENFYIDDIRFLDLVNSNCEQSVNRISVAINLATSSNQRYWRAEMLRYLLDFDD